MYDRADIQRVLDRTDIVRVIGASVALKPKGREHVGLCPFHNDRTPSMYVSPAKGIFKCFACGEAGDVLSFLMKFHGMEFPEALEHLAQQAGVELVRARPALPAAHTQRSPQDVPAATKAELIDAAKLAQSFFRAILRHADHGKAARAMLERRGVSPEMVDRFGLGASPERWDGLASTLASHGLGHEPFVAAGLLKQRDSGDGCYDFFRHRLMFPITDALGRPIAFGGRAIAPEDEKLGKYINSRESLIYRKSAVLYALHEATPGIRRSGQAVVTEGYLDTIACHQAGLDNTVATLGTALTAEHARVLSRLCDGVVLLFDGDEAGARAADRAVEVFFAHTLDVRIATLASVSDAKDPDELLKRPGGVDLLRRAIDSATDLLEFRFSRLRAELAGAGPARLVKRVEEELASLVRLGLDDLSPVRRELILRALPRATGLDSFVLRSSLARVRTSTPRASAEAGQDSAPQAESETTSLRHGPLRAHEWLLAVALVDPSFAAGLARRQRAALLSPARFDDPTLTSLASAAIAEFDAGRTPTLQALRAVLGDSPAIDAAASLCDRALQEIGGDTGRLAQLWADCARRLQHDLPAGIIEPRPSKGDGSDGADPRDTGQPTTLDQRLAHARLRHQQSDPDRRRLPGVGP